MAKLSSLVWTPPWSAVSWHRFGIKAPTSWCTPKRLCTKSRNSTCGAPKARNMIARGKRRAQRDASPLDHNQVDYEALKERNTTDDISHFQCSLQFISHNQGRRVSLCSPLAPGYHISRLWRSVHRIPTFCAKLRPRLRRTHPLPQVVLTVSKKKPSICTVFRRFNRSVALTPGNADC